MSAFVSRLKELFRFDFSLKGFFDFEGPSMPPSFRAGEDINEAVWRDMQRDYDAMADAWYQVGQDMRQAMGQVYREMSEEEQQRLLAILEKTKAKKRMKSPRNGKGKR